MQEEGKEGSFMPFGAQMPPAGAIFCLQKAEMSRPGEVSSFVQPPGTRAGAQEQQVSAATLKLSVKGLL